MNDAAKKQEPVAATARRIGLPDMFKHGQWMISRYITKYPGLTEQNALGYFRVMMDDGVNYLFIINEGGVALFEQLTDIMRGRIVRERFVFVFTPEDIPQAALLYGDMFRWAESIAATEAQVDVFTDIPRNLIRKHTAPLYTREVVFVKTERKL